MDGKGRLTFGAGDRAQVAVVTGAGRGLGRAWALALAERGARVVVNDNDADRSLVDGAVRAIREAGGTAVADYHSVTDGAKVVQTALNHFQRVDILINVRLFRCRRQDLHAARALTCCPRVFARRTRRSSGMDRSAT